MDLLIAVDTNVLVRFFYLDLATPEHTARARFRVFMALEGGYRVYVPTVVLVETVWVFTSRMKLDKVTVAQIVGQLVESSLFVMEDPEVAFDAYYRWKADVADFADYMSLRRAYEVQAVAFLTFDGKIRDPLAVEP